MHQFKGSGKAAGRTFWDVALEQRSLPKRGVGILPLVEGIDCCVIAKSMLVTVAQAVVHKPSQHHGTQHVE